MAAGSDKRRIIHPSKGDPMAVLHSNLIILPIHPQGDVSGVTLAAAIRELLAFIVVMASAVALVCVMYRLEI
jgi:hypothetical protein